MPREIMNCGTVAYAPRFSTGDVSATYRGTAGEDAPIAAPVSSLESASGTRGAPAGVGHDAHSSDTVGGHSDREARGAATDPRAPTAAEQLLPCARLQLRQAPGAEASPRHHNAQLAAHHVLRRAGHRGALACVRVAGRQLHGPALHHELCHAQRQTGHHLARAPRAPRTPRAPRALAAERVHV